MNKRKNNLIAAAFILVTLLLMLYFGYRSYQTDNAARGAYQLVLIPKAIDAQNGFWSSLTEGARLGASEMGADLEIMGPRTEEDVDGQLEKLQEAIDMKPDAILIAASDYKRVTPLLEKARKKGIVIILIDSLIDKDLDSGIVATDNVKAGKELGEYVRNDLIDSGKSYAQIAMVGHVEGVSTAVDREKGMREGLGEFEQNIIDVVFGGYSYDTAYAITKDLLTKYPQLDIIMGMNEYSSVGAAKAVKDMGRAGQVKMFGFDNSVEEIQLLEQGVFDAIVIQKPVNMGYLGVEQAVGALSGKEPKKNIDSGSKLITRTNMYLDENQRLLYPFSGQ